MVLSHCPVFPCVHSALSKGTARSSLTAKGADMQLQQQMRGKSQFPCIPPSCPYHATLVCLPGAESNEIPSLFPSLDSTEPGNKRRRTTKERRAPGSLPHLASGAVRRGWITPSSCPLPTNMPCRPGKPLPLLSSPPPCGGDVCPGMIPLPLSLCPLLGFAHQGLWG